MKKIVIMAVSLLALIALAACGGNGDTREAPTMQNENYYANVGGEETFETLHGWTVDELGEIIVAAGSFWNDWWNFRGAFAWEHIDDSPWYFGVEQPEHPLSRGFVALLPSSGFETLADIGVHLQQFYSDIWVLRELLGDEPTEFTVADFEIFFGSPSAFEEYDGVLYVHADRIGAMRPDWNTATHILISQNDNIAVVETTVAAYDHRGSGDKMPTATFRFVFYNGRIENGLGQWKWPET